MAKNFTHLKPSILQAYEQGKSVLEVIKFFKLPKSTAYDWHKEYKESKLPKSTPPKNPEPPQAPAPIVLSGELVEPERPFRVIDGGRDDSDLTDFQIVRKTFRDILKDPDVSPAVKVSAAQGLMRLIPLKLDIPKHVLEENETTSLEAERKSLEGMSAEELAREYKLELERTKTLT